MMQPRTAAAETAETPAEDRNAEATQRHSSSHSCCAGPSKTQPRIAVAASAETPAEERRNGVATTAATAGRDVQPTSSDGNHAERRPPHVEEEEGENMDVGAFAEKEETQEGWCRSIGGRYVPEEKVEEVLARRRERKHLNLKKNKAMAERTVDKLEVRLPLGTEKIILRPAGGIDSIKKKLGVFAGNAILEAAGLPPMAEEDIVFNKNNQTILISTPNKERAEAFAKIKNIRAGEEDIEMTAHPAMPEGGKGVIYGINLELTEEQIHKALDNPRNPTYTAVRRLGRTSESVIINFKELEVPKTVKFFSQWIPCHLYKKKYDVCYACGKIGHRQDVCPDPRSTRCRGCGLRNPPEEHACEPKCLLCGKKHQLGDPTCRELYRKPHWVKQRDAARAEARAEQEKGGATAGRSRPTSKVALPPAAKKQRSESRDRSASRPPPRDNQTHWPGLQKPGDKRPHSGMPVSFASAVSQGRTPELEAQANLFKKEIEKRDEENSQLREIIKTLTETVNQLKEQVGQLTNPTVRATQAEPTRPLTPVQRIAAPQTQDEGSMVVDTVGTAKRKAEGHETPPLERRKKMNRKINEDELEARLKEHEESMLTKLSVIIDKKLQAISDHMNALLTALGSEERTHPNPEPPSSSEAARSSSSWPGQEL